MLTLYFHCPWPSCVCRDGTTVMAAWNCHDSKLSRAWRSGNTLPCDLKAIKTCFLWGLVCVWTALSCVKCIMQSCEPFIAPWEGIYTSIHTPRLVRVLSKSMSVHLEHSQKKNLFFLLVHGCFPEPANREQAPQRIARLQNIDVLTMSILQQVHSRNHKVLIENRQKHGRT